MNSITNRTAKSIMGVFAASLLASTLLTGSLAVSTAPQAFAQGTIASIDPTKGFAPLVEHVMPSVVSVEVKYLPAAAESAGDPADVPPQLKDFFEQFPQFKDRFRGPQGPQGEQGGGVAVGSGFVISDDGYIVTNNHVVKDASTVKITFQGGKEYDAKVIGTDPKTDLALLKIDSDSKFDYVPLSTHDAKVGDWVMAVGNPFGLGGTVTAGIVSARGRDIGSGPYDDFLQIDASINKGNSGGPSFNLEGEVIGVNSAIFSPSGGSVGIGFAIPASVVNSVVEELKSNGTVTRGYLGVQIQPVTADIAESLGLDKAEGAIISALSEKSPALKAGLKQGDTIIKANGETIADAKALSREVARLKPGTSIPFEIVREGKRQTVDVEIGTMPGEVAKMMGKVKDKSKLDLSDLGITVAPAVDGVGVKITDLDPKSEAAQRGLKPGDVILQIAGADVTSAADVENALKDVKTKKVLMLVKSGDNQSYITLPRDQG
jgi:serine protease Do